MANDDMLDYVERQRNRDNNYSISLKELSERQDLAQKQMAEQQAIIHAQEKELDINRQRLKKEQIEREKEYAREREERDRFFEERERSLIERQHKSDVLLQERMKDAEELRYKLKHEVAEKEHLLKKAYEELEIEKQRYTEESRKEIESKSQAYVNTALTGLQSKEDNFHWLSKLWASIGAIAIFSGILFIIVSTFFGAESFHDSGEFSWSYFLFITFRGLIVVAMFVALARYAFIYSNSYMHESLKNGERRHAINFGKFYLEAYGANADWDQVKDAFQHWNISSESAFSKKQTSEFDPKLVENAVELSKIFADKGKDKAPEAAKA